MTSMESEGESEAIGVAPRFGPKIRSKREGAFVCSELNKFHRVGLPLKKHATRRSRVLRYVGVGFVRSPRITNLFASDQFNVTSTAFAIWITFDVGTATTA